MKNFWTERSNANSESQQSEMPKKRQSGRIAERIKSLAASGKHPNLFGPSDEPKAESSHQVVKAQLKHNKDLVSRPKTPKSNGISADASSAELRRESSKLSHPTKGRARGPQKNRLSGSAKDFP
jgi:hypothetical protein